MHSTKRRPASVAKPFVLHVLLCTVAISVGCAPPHASTSHIRERIANVSTPPESGTYLSGAIARYIANMSLDQRIEQLLVLQLSTTTYSGASVDMMRQFQPGAVILYEFAMPSITETRAMTAAMQHQSHIPLLICSDVEGGAIDNLASMFPAGRPNATQMGRLGDTKFIYRQGLQAARDMLSVGINVNLAPDVDVQTADGPDQFDRTFGTNPGAVSTFAGAYLDGLQAGGVIGTLKHYPGLGGATSDAHQGLPVINHSRDEIYSVDLAPYRYLIDRPDPPGVIMSTDLLMPALDPVNPAELSPAIIGMLRTELHFNGVVMTDALYMTGIASEYSMDEAAVRALIAGADLLLGPSTIATTQSMLGAIKEAVREGRLSEQRIDASVLRVLTLKAERGLWQPPRL